jgi:hypothetical protein
LELYLYEAAKGNSPALLKLVQLLRVLICVACVSVNADGRSRVTISIPTPGQLNVVADLSTPARSWSFRNAYASALGLAERVGEFQAFTESGKDARAKQSATGEFRSEIDASRIFYSVRLSNPRASDLPHTSWLADDRGILMFADLLPVDVVSASAVFGLPTGWAVESSITPDRDGRYEVLTPEKAVFIIGRQPHKASKSVGGMMLETVVYGSWR